MEEIWKDVPEYEGYYQVSNLGRVKSLERHIIRSDGKKAINKELILRQASHYKGYTYVRLTVGSITKTYKTHRLVLLAFVGPSDLQVDHLNQVKDDNRLENLEYVTNRENISRKNRTIQKTSKHIGVNFDKKTGKWCAKIYYDGKHRNLGMFKDELAAHHKYQERLNEITNQNKC